MSAFANPALLKALETTFGIKCSVNKAMPLSVVLRQAATLAKEAEKEDAKAKKLREREDKKTFGYGTKHRAKLLDQLAKYTSDPGMKGASLEALETWLRICKESAKSAKPKKKPRANKALIQTHRWTGGALMHVPY